MALTIDAKNNILDCYAAAASLRSHAATARSGSVMPCSRFGHYWLYSILDPAPDLENDEGLYTEVLTQF